MGRGAGFGILLLTLVFGACGQRDLDLPAVVKYNYHIRPILSDRCYPCHGPDDNARQASLRLHTEEGALGFSRDDSTIRIVAPGNPEASKLIAHVTSNDPDRIMPPPSSNLTLSSHDIALLKRWIAQGASWQPHWAFVPPKRPERPHVRHEKQVRNDVDAFVLRRLDQEGLEPAPEADKAKLLRRVTLDLTGLPPTLEELDTFLADSSPNAYERTVHDLLARPAYGERMASLWLDVARYADTHGYQDDRPRTMWPWRDWVIRAFNSNMPYDAFITWQLAGDLLPDATYEQRLATGFNRNHAITQEGGVVPAEYITEYVADRTHTVATAFMGLTMECARCHDHKYDPILQREYYQMFAFFNSVDEQAPISYFDLAPRPAMRMKDPHLDSLIAHTARAITVEEQLLESYPSDAEHAPQVTMPGNSAALVEYLQRDLLAHYPLDSYVDLASPNAVGPPARANTGLVSELSPPDTVPGRHGSALKFDGQNFLSLGAEPDFEWYDRFSIAAWVHLETHESETAIFSKRIDEQKGIGYDVTRTQEGWLSVRLVYDGAQHIHVHSTRPVTTHRWSHVAVTYDGSGKARGLKLFVNGTQSATTVLRDSLNRQSILNGNDLLAGHWSHRNQTRSDLAGLAGGAIDDIRIYTRELSRLEVAHLANIQAPPGAYKHHTLVHHDPIRAVHVQRLDSLRRSWRTVPSVMVMEDMEQSRTTFVLARGAYDAPLDSVGPGTPAAIGPMPAALPRNRLGMARWLTDPDHPLTARVAINRFWQMLFGEGLVHTPEDFGSQGALPTHPELLDHLAVTFVASGWNLKALLFDIVTSATYRQSSTASQNMTARDPSNALLARGPRVRLSAEMMRDNALAASGLLHQEIGGEPVRPYQPAGLWKSLANQIGENRYRPGRGRDLYRRSLYTYWKRTIPPPAMLTFDAPERTICAVERQSTATPQQSLVLLNDPQYVEAARVLAEQLAAIETLNDAARITRAFRLFTSRRPLQSELENLQILLQKQRIAYERGLERATRLVHVGARRPNNRIRAAEVAAWTVVVSTVMNLDEAQMR